MKLWIAAEADIEVADIYRETRKHIEKLINEELEVISSNLEWRKWAVILVIRKVQSDKFPELWKYNKRDETLEFRLAVDFNLFVKADPIERCRIFLGVLGRSVKMMP